MKTVTIRDLRYDFARVESLLKAGETIAITRHAKVVAEVSPPREPVNGKLVLPDFAARRRRIWGDRVFSAEEVERMRVEETGEP